MRSPEHLHHQPAPPRAGKNFEVDLHLRYLSPGAFTILPANEQHLPPDPPSAPDPFRLTPTSRRHKNQSFAIIGEPTSRSTSPTPSGRVSPFRGHGFNPSGSRLASPSSSPPPEDLRYPPKPKTKIPKPSRHQNQHVFGEKVSTTNLQTRRKLSQSLTSLESTKKTSSFKRLSPIIGSSPEPSQVSLSSPSRIPKSRSQPPSRLTSPTRVTSKPPIRPTVSSPAKKHYKNVQAKVNSFSSKAKVPNIERKNVNSTNAHAPKILVKRQQSVSKINLPPKNEDSNNNKPAPPPKMKKEIPPDKEPPKKPMKESRKISEISPIQAPPQDQETPKNQIAEAPKVNAPRDSEKTENPNPVKLTDLLQPTATTVVSSTTSTVTQPLKIEAKIEPMIFDKPKPVSPMVDGRVLSATSVSHAMNRMSDTQSVIKDGFTTGNSLSPEANAVISMAHESKVLKNGGNFENSLKKLTQPIDNAVQKSVNERIKEARAMVQPIRIIVKEKGADAEVQSGNVRISATNGLNNVRPGLPADNHHSPPNEPNNANNNTSEEAPAKKNACCTKFFSKMQCCKKEENSPPSKGCFSCLKKKPEQVRINIEDEDEPKTGSCLGKLKCCGGKNNRISDSSCFPTGKRKDSWAQRRDSILSDPQPAPSRCSKDCCTNLMRKLFCINLCCKKKVVEAPDLSRKASVISKKKSLTLTTAPPLEDTTPKLDLSLVEHASAMKGAIPVLPICLAWFCLVMNCIAPGTGTVFSGMFCLCIGIPRFSQKDGAKGRIGSFIINLIIGVGQFFTVLFCLVGWGWSIWWGVIMIKIAKKYKKIKQLEKLEEDDARPPATQNHRDVEHGAS